MQSIELKSIKVTNNKVEYEYEVTEKIKQFFLDTPFFLEYSINEKPLDISPVPESILAVPFVCNLLPIAWITNSILIVPELDKDFLDTIPQIKLGYQRMFPNVAWGGDVLVQRVVPNLPVTQVRSAAFFSGGVDSWCTLMRHMDESPDLIAIWGSDVPWDNESGWHELRDSLRETADDLLLPLITVRSTFRRTIYEDCLTWTFEKALEDNWWHGVQHGIAIISHAAPSNYLRGVSTQYIAASHCPEDGVVKCASDPSIDNFVRFGGCRVVHDAYISRQEKIRYILDYCKRHSQKAKLHVCWETDSGENCCRCEKCYRTIVGILIEGGDPADYGFPETKVNLKHMQQLLQDEYVYSESLKPIWRQIGMAARRNHNILKNNKDYKYLKWIESFNFEKPERNFHRKLYQFEHGFLSL